MNRAEKRRQKRKNKGVKSISPEFKAQLNTAVESLHSKNHDQGYQLTTQLLQEYPDNIQLLNIHSLLAIELGEITNAHTHLKKAMNLSPKNPTLLNNLAKVHFVQKEYEQAIQAYQRAKIHAPENFEITFNIGKVWDTKECFKEAITSYQEVLDENPIFFPAWKLLAQVYHKINDLEKALETYKTAQRLNSEDHTVNNNIMRILNKLERWGEAKESATTQNQLLWADSLTKQKKYEEAIKIYNAHLSSDPKDFETSIMLSNCYQALEKVDQGIEVLESFKEETLSSDQINLMKINLGSFYLIQKKYSKAINILLEVYSLNNSDPLLVKLISKTYEKLDEATNSIKFFEIYAKLNPEEETIVKLFQLYWNNGFPQKIIEHYHSLKIYTSQNKTLEELYFKSLAVKGNFKEVTTSFQTNSPMKKYLEATIKEYHDNSIENVFPIYQELHKQTQQHHISSFQQLSLWKIALNEIPDNVKKHSYKHPKITLVWSPNNYISSLITQTLLQHTNTSHIDIKEGINKIIKQFSSTQNKYPNALQTVPVESYLDLFLDTLPTLDKEADYLISPLPEYAIHLPLLTHIFPNLQIIILEESLLKDSWELYRKEEHLGLFPTFDTAVNYCKEQITFMNTLISQYQIQTHRLLMKNYYNKKELFLKELYSILKLTWSTQKNHDKQLSFQEFHPHLLSIYLNTPFDYKKLIQSLTILEN